MILLYSKGTGFSPYIKEARTLGLAPEGSFWADVLKKQSD
jgi:hypothetical protein